MLKWQSFSPIREDFDSKFDLFDLENYLYVLFGMNYLPKKEQLSEQASLLAEQQVDLKKRRVEQLLIELPSHRGLINKIAKFGLQKL